MKRFVLILTSVVLVSTCIGCASNNTGDSSESSSDSVSAEEQTQAPDLLGITGPIAEPPIACTKEASIENVTVKIPEDWTAEIGVAGYLKIYADDDKIVGSISVSESSLSASNSDEELMEYANSALEQQRANGFTLEDTFVVQRKGDFGYLIIPFMATQTDSEGATKDYWGYSLCGYDHEMVIADLSCEQDDKEVLETFRWILENIEVN